MLWCIRNDNVQRFVIVQKWVYSLQGEICVKQIDKPFLLSLCELRLKPHECTSRTVRLTRPYARLVRLS